MTSSNESAGAFPLGAAGASMSSPGGAPAVTTDEIVKLLGDKPLMLRSIDYAIYDALPGERSSTLKAILKSPLAYQHRLAMPRPDTQSLRVGRAVHMAILEPERFESRGPGGIAIYPGANADGKKQVRRGGNWEEFQAKHADKTILSESEFNTAWRMAAAVRRHPLAWSYLSEQAERELTVTWVDEATGTRVKVRIDHIGVVLAELKTGIEITPRASGNAANSYGYHMQIAMQNLGASLVGLGPLPTKIIWLEKVPPFDCAVDDVDPSAVAKGAGLYCQALARLAECRSTNEWPGAYPQERTLTLPSYATNDEEENNEGESYPWEESNV